MKAKKVRLSLYLYGIRAIYTAPLSLEEAEFRTNNWKAVYGWKIPIRSETV